MSTGELAAVERARASLTRASKAQTAARKAFHEAIRAAVDAGVPSADVARVAGVSKARVSQVAPVTTVPETPIHAQETAESSVRVNDPDTVRGLPDTGENLSGIVSLRRRTPYGRETVFLPGSLPLADILAASLAREAGRVYLTGPAPMDTSTGATQAEAVRAWAMQPVGDGWSVSSAGHYLASPTLPTLRFVHASGAKVAVMRAASWWGESDADPVTCAAAWRGLGQVLDRVPAFAGAGLADTPATTGRALWLRTIPEGKGYPVLSDELRELIAATSGQGRVELRDPPRVGRVPQLVGHDFTYLDGRFMYAALTWGMPVGEPVRWTGDAVAALSDRDRETLLRGRGRWRITATVPAGWEHVGLLMAPRGDDAWHYPDAPGQTMTTWADGSEVWLAMLNRWPVTIHEGITWAEGKPLDTWRDALVKVWEAANASPEPAAALAARAVRSILLFALGAFAARSHPITHSAPLDEPPDVPAGTEVRQVGDRWLWQVNAKPSAWSLETAHPEWSATVWARARGRLLSARGVNGQQVGALHLPPAAVVAFSTDALYLAGGAPDWADDGKPGRFRVKGIAPGEFEWPSSYSELYSLRDMAERA